MMLADERLLEEKKEFYRRRLFSQLKDSFGLVLESLDGGGDIIARGALKALEHAERTSEEIGDEKLKELVEKTGAFLASLIVGE